VKITTVDAANFAGTFNEKFPGVHRKVTIGDIMAMVSADLIGRYGRLLYYIDLKTVWNILRYERIRSLHPDPPPISEEEYEPPQCRLCGQTLPAQKEGKRGRPREYCDNCIIKRAIERKRQWRARKSKARRKSGTKISLR
jgi:hypothetical protein